MPDGETPQVNLDIGTRPAPKRRGRPTKVAAEATNEAIGRVFRIPKDKRNDPQAYLNAGGEVQDALGEGRISPSEAVNMLKVLQTLCQSHTGLDYEDVAQAQVDPVVKFRSLMDTGEDELLRLETSFAKIDALESEKKRWSDHIHRAIKLQHEARKHPAKFTVYVSRDDSTGEVVTMEQFHLDYYNVWQDKDAQNTLIEAPVGHGKSFNMRYLICFRIGKTPTRRRLYLTDSKDKASKTVMAIKKTLKSPRYKAIFPDVRIMTRADDSQDTSLRFTVFRGSVNSREPTFEGAGIVSEIQGNRYDEIYADDPCPPDVQNSPQLREAINTRWSSVVETRIDNPHTSRIDMICTPWHTDDIAGKITKDFNGGRLPNWRVEIDRFRIKDDADGMPIPLWAKFDSGYLQGRKLRNGKAFDLNYRLTFGNVSNITVRRIQWYNAERNSQWTMQKDLELLDAIEKAERWLSVDPAGTAGRNSCDTGIVDFAITANGYGFVVGVYYIHKTTGEMIADLADMIIAGPGNGYYGLQIENESAVKIAMPMMIQELRLALSNGGYDPDRLVILTNDTSIGNTSRQKRSKGARLSDCSSVLENGLVRFAGTRINNHRAPSYCGPRPDSDLARLAEAIVHFDGTRLADGVDALTQWILANRQRLAPEKAIPAPIRINPLQHVDPRAAQVTAYIDKLAEDAESERDSGKAELDFLLGRTLDQRSNDLWSN